jgi:pimeloyl-ACP methyl ester carboxylesterase
VSTQRRHYTGKDGVERVYETHLLRRSFREDGKVRNETVANLSHVPAEAIRVLRLSLAGTMLVEAGSDVTITRSVPHGHVAAVWAIAQQLGLPAIVGVSMGGCISQSLAIAHPERVRSLTSISSSTGSRRVGRPRFDIARFMVVRKPAKDREEAIAQSVETWRRIGSPGYPFNLELVQQLAGEAYDRSYDPAGGARQFAAILGSPDRTSSLRTIEVPTLVLHGEADPLITVSGGAATAAAIPGARFVTYPGMAHDLPEALWPRFVEEISDIVARGEARRTH